MRRPPTYADGIVTRRVVLEPAPGGCLPDGYAVTGAQPDAAVRRTGVDGRSGDARPPVPGDAPGPCRHGHRRRPRPRLPATRQVVGVTPQHTAPPETWRVTLPSLPGATRVEHEGRRTHLLTGDAGQLIRDRVTVGTDFRDPTICVASLEGAFPSITRRS